jgi:mRNA interferase HicA
MKRLELEKKLKQVGRWFKRHGGKHDVWTNGEREVAIPRHNEINEYTAKAIIKEAKGDSR